MIASLIVTPIALLLGVASADVGHGDYRLAIVLFPYTMLSVLIFKSITLPFIVLALIQFPAYGFVLGEANEKGRLQSIGIILAVIHGLATAIIVVDCERDCLINSALRENRR